MACGTEGTTSRLRGVQDQAVFDRPCAPFDNPRTRGDGAAGQPAWQAVGYDVPNEWHTRALARGRQLDPLLCQQR